MKTSKSVKLNELAAAVNRRRERRACLRVPAPAPGRHTQAHDRCQAWNGAGYPDRLTGEAIPLGARITAVAEAYSALTAWRPYREAWDARVAMSELHKGVEKGRYDPKVVKALDELMSASA